MVGDTLIVLLPLLAMLIAAISIAGLWYWWSSGEENAKGEQAELETGEAPAASEPEEPTLGDFLSRLRGLKRFLLPPEPLTLTGSDAANAPIEAVPLASSTSTQPGIRSEVAPALAPPQVSQPAPSLAIQEGFVEVLRIYRDLADGSVVIEIDGQRYRHLDEIVEPQARRRFLGNAQALVQFAGLGGAMAIPEAEVPSRSTTSPAPTPPPPMQPPAPVRGPSSQQMTEAEQQPRRRGLFQFGPAKQEEPTEPKSMADEIEELIQYRLTLNPALVQRSIHIRPGHSGGVRIEVDGQSFDGVADIPDDTVREFIQSVIREWEARQ